MKRICAIIRNILISVILLTGINQVIFAGPYIALCIGIVCQYYQAPSQIGRCTGGTLDLYAVNPKPQGPFIPCYGTRQWYTLVVGWICVGNICHQGLVPSAIDGATSNMYTVTAKGKYWCTVDCGSGAYNTDTVEFFYDTEAPTIYIDPQNQTICEGTGASFSVSASAYYMSYSWQKMVPLGSWTSISGANSSTYSYTPSAGDDLSQFRCAVSNGCGTSYSNGATLDIKFKPAISQNPSNASVCAGTSSNFSIGATGDNLSYQWQLSANGGTDWGNIFTSGQYSVNNEQMSVSDITSNMSGYIYRCAVSGYCPPSATSSGATLTVKTMPVITSSPVSIEKCAGDAATFNVQASGTVPMEYYWRKDEGSGSWSSSAEYTIPAVSAGDAGSYDVLIRNECYPSGVESNNATLTVYALPNVGLGADKHICEGSDLVLDAGAGLKGYSWSTGETTRTITVNDEAEYSVTVTDNNNCSQSDNIYVFLDPQIPSVNLGNDVTVCLGESVILDAGSGYDNYSWSTGAETQTVNISATGDYSVQVSNNGNVCKNLDTIHVLVAEPFGDEKVCLVTVDQETNKNVVIFEKTPDKGVLYYNIYRQSNVFGKYDSIGSLLVDELSVFIDEGANPEQQQYLYKISVVDTCGNESELSPYHKTLFLQYVSSEGGVNLRWDKYEVEGVPINFESYVIKRGTDSTKLSEIKTISGDLNSWIDTDPVATTKRQYYRIAGVKSEVCDPAHILGKKAGSGPYSQSMSNLEDNRFLVGFNNLKSSGELAIYPNPANDYLTVRFPNPNHSDHQLVIRDLTGKAVMLISNITEEKVIIERGNLKAGYYSVEVIGEHIYRGKMVLE